LIIGGSKRVLADPNAASGDAGCDQADRDRHNLNGLDFAKRALGALAIAAGSIGFVWWALRPDLRWWWRFVGASSVPASAVVFFFGVGALIGAV
jgi:hypothetical protein